MTILYTSGRLLKGAFPYREFAGPERPPETEEYMKALRAERKDRHWTQTELGAQVGVSQGDVSEFETGRRIPTPAQALKLSKVLGLPPDRLLAEVREPAPDTAEADSRG